MGLSKQIFDAINSRTRILSHFLATIRYTVILAPLGIIFGLISAPSNPPYVRKFMVLRGLRGYLIEPPSTHIFDGINSHDRRFLQRILNFCNDYV